MSIERKIILDELDEYKASITYKYLVKNNLLQRYIRLFREYKKIDEKIKKEELKGILLHYQIMFAFNWAQTSEGRTFWLNHHNKLDNLLCYCNKKEKHKIKI